MQGCPKYYRTASPLAAAPIRLCHTVSFGQRSPLQTCAFPVSLSYILSGFGSILQTYLCLGFPHIAPVVTSLTRYLRYSAVKNFILEKDITYCLLFRKFQNEEKEINMNDEKYVIWLMWNIWL